jgi:hypothetical protein
MDDPSQAYRQYFNIVYFHVRQTFAIVKFVMLTVQNTSLPDTDLCTYRTAARPKCFFIIIYLNCKWVFTRWQCTTIRHNTQITHNAQTKHSTQNYTNNKGHTTHNEYNANTITTTIRSIRGSSRCLPRVSRFPGSHGDLHEDLPIYRK